MARATMGDGASPVLDAAPAADDRFYLLDKSDTADDANGTVKEITTSRLFETPATSLSPVMVTGDLTLVSATHHGKTLEINTGTSPRITCAQIGAGVKCDIHRPAIQPSPILLPPATTAIWLGGADMGFNRIRADGSARVHYSNANVPKVSGDLEWGGYPTTTDVASLLPHTDLRRGEGLSTAVIGDPVSAWTSYGSATKEWGNATAGEQPTLNEDGTLEFDAVTDECRLLLQGGTLTFAGDVVAICAALRWKEETTYDVRLFEAVGMSSSKNFRLYNDASGVMRLDMNAGAGGANIQFTFTQSQWLCFALIIGYTDQKIWLYSNSRVSGQQRRIYTSVTTIPDWTSWDPTSVIIGNAFTTHSEKFDLASFDIVDGLDNAISGGAINDDIGIRLLGKQRMMLPDGADG